MQALWGLERRPEWLKFQIQEESRAQGGRGQAGLRFRSQSESFSFWPEPPCV